MPSKLGPRPEKNHPHPSHWYEVRQAVRERDKVCRLCGEPDPEKLTVHHVTYENWGNEKPEDCTLLCNECHCDFHAWREHKRKKPKRKKKS